MNTNIKFWHAGLFIVVYFTAQFTYSHFNPQEYIAFCPIAFHDNYTNVTYNFATFDDRKNPCPKGSDLWGFTEYNHEIK